MPNPVILKRISCLGGQPSPVDNFLAATGITDATIRQALNGMYSGLVSNSLYSKFIALYPMVGGTSTTTKYNFINPVDSDAAYRISWAGGLTFASTGVTPNGTNGYGNTFINNNLFTQNNMTLGGYSRTNIIGASRLSQCAIGAYSAPNLSLIYFGASYGINSVYPGTSSFSVTSQRHFAVSRLLSTNVNIVAESIAATTQVVASVAPFSAQINIFRLGGFAGDYDVKESAFNYVATGMTTTELNTLTTIINTFQTTLGRNV